MNNKFFYELKKRKPQLEHILRANPYENLNNIDGLLDEETFREIFLCKNDESFNRTIMELKDKVFSSWEANEIILVYGYSGAGKTTLIRHFLNENRDSIHYKYIDFHKSDINHIDGHSSTEPAITQMLRRQYLKEAHSSRILAIETAKIYYDKIEFTDDFRSVLSEHNNNNINNDILKYATFKDIFLLYMLLLFLDDEQYKKSSNKYLLVFDNLDAVDIEFVTPNFLDKFASAFEAVADMSQKSFLSNPRFTARYRFVFTLREGNFALVSEHFADRLQQSIESLPLPLRLSPILYKKIFMKRLNIIRENKIYSSDQNEIDYVMSILDVWSQDAIFNKIIVNLFNRDYRKIVTALLKTAKKIKNVDWELWQISMADRNVHVYGYTGILIRGMIDYWIEPFSEHYFSIQQDIDINDYGYMQPLRMVLNMVLNLSQENTMYNEQRQECNKDTTLYQLIIYLKDIYPCKTILYTVARLFLYHNHWVQLLSVYGIPIKTEDSIYNEILSKYPMEVKAIDECNINEKENVELVKYLKSIKLKITPAGIVYLRHIHTHYEFYSALSKNEHPLFIVGELAIKNLKKEIQKAERDNISDKIENELLEMQNMIDTVYTLVKAHLNITIKFYKNHFEKRKKMTINQYLKSKYTYKPVGKTTSSMGYMHISRVISSHIDYLDKYRQYLLKELNQMEIEIKTREAIQIHVNMALVSNIEKYTELLLRLPDERMKQWYNKFMEKIRKIKNSEYTDIKTEIKM